MQEELTCHACQVPVLDTRALVRADERVFHREHFRCVECDKRLGTTGDADWCRHGDAYYCRWDFSNSMLDKCVYCEKRMRGHRLVNSYGEVICAPHKLDANTDPENPVVTDCQDCGRVVPLMASVRYGPRMPRLQCDSCQYRSVKSDEVARGLLAHVRLVLNREYNLDMRRLHVPITLLSLNELQQEVENKPHGEAPYLLGGVTTVEPGTSNIRWVGLPTGISADHLCMIIAHELGHVYFHINNFQQMDWIVMEGTCELVAYLWITAQANAGNKVLDFWADQMIRGNHPLYHAGFHQAKRAFDWLTDQYGRAHALPALLGRIKATGQFPELGGYQPQWVV
eukprot:NODE_100_length_3356_cov_57.345809_g93_i0.p1 GENE.NODE_100_length_3356_cov_57.345809_g93_i0~~NODE_100_length_3356_cov_57.345809_g93_i0.p1  ORF type:complete len:340 (-),score=29.70 NODE_100_length_3356_cov_57.345809_g93_i0:197-1216(-)